MEGKCKCSPGRIFPQNGEKKSAERSIKILLMERSITDEQNEAPRLIYGSQRSTHDGVSGLLERITERDFSFASGKLREVLFGHFHIGYCELQLKNNGEVPVEVKTPSIEMEFVLMGNCKRTYPDDPNKFILNQNEHNLSFVAPTKTTSKWHSENQKVKLLQINIEPEYFVDYLNKELNSHTQLEALKASIQKGNYLRFSNVGAPITPKMRQVIDQIIDCRRNGMVKRIFLESRILYLMALQLEQLLANKSVLPNFGITQETVAKLSLVKTYLENNLDNKNLTLQFLARYVGTNEFTLKRGFKQLWGVTVFGYFRQLKMQRASQMLLGDSQPIAEIADQLGYKNARHFSTAFKKIFGVTPKDYRKNLS